MKYIIALLAASLLFSTSCKKYEDGPILSLKSKKSRVENTWVVNKAYDKGNDVTSSFEQYELYTTKDGVAKLKAKYELGSLSFEVETDGRWNFQDDKDNIYFDYDNDVADKKYEILKLTEKEFHIKELGGNLVLQLHPK